ncbi:MAG: hypothetical protein EU529_17060 [Promethearchaeota archaeon]|nr:MAG: hypothetical protein EU529_17060 [Candidatus Lokiarchaeota archaeon]
MTIKDLLNLAINASKGKDNFGKGAIGFNGHGFVFRDLYSNTSYINSLGSSKVFAAGTFHKFTSKNFKLFENLNEIIIHDIDSDLILAGSIKTLVPTLIFGGYELLFDVWVFFSGTNGTLFPIRFYFGQTGTSIAGWHLNDKNIPMEIKNVINSSPFNFSDVERDDFLESLELAIGKVPVSDFWGVYSHDLGNTLMCLENGRPFIKELGRFERISRAEIKIKNFLGHYFRTPSGDLFTVRLLPERGIYVVDFTINQKVLSHYDLVFGNAKQILENIQIFQQEGYG